MRDILREISHIEWRGEQNQPDGHQGLSPYPMHNAWLQNCRLIAPTRRAANWWRRHARRQIACVVGFGITGLLDADNSLSPTEP
jgi:hypothetical protein